MTAELNAFEAAYATIHEVEVAVGVLSADICRHITSLQGDDCVCRTSEMQATLSLEEIEKIVADLVKARDTLLAVLMKSGVSD